MVVYTSWALAARAAQCYVSGYLGAKFGGDLRWVSALALSRYSDFKEQLLQLFSVDFSSFLSVGAMALVYPPSRKQSWMENKMALSLLSEFW